MRSSTKIALACVLFGTLSVTAQINNIEELNAPQKSETLAVASTGIVPVIEDTIIFRGERQKPGSDVVPNNLSTAEEVAPLKFNLYPNPSQGMVELAFTEGAVPQKIEVYSVIGNLVYQYRVDDSSASKIALDLSELSSGNYIVVATSKSKIHTQKLSIN